MSSRRRQKAERPAQLLEAAFALFLERGFAATRIDDIAERAQVSKGTVYLYYPSKEALLTAAVEELLLPRLANLRQILEPAEQPAWPRLRQVFEAMWTLAVDPQGLAVAGLPKLMISECGNFPDLARRFVERWIAPMQDEVLLGLVQQGLASGEFQVDDPAYQVRVIVAGFVFQLVWRHSLAEFDGRGLDMRRYFNAWLAQTHAVLVGTALPADELAAEAMSLTGTQP